MKPDVPLVNEKVRSDLSYCVFAGSAEGNQAKYADSAEALGRELAARGAGLVYGGARIGLMGALANTVLGSGGAVTGVIPRPLAEREVAHDGLTTLHLVSSMHERKQLMADLSDGFIALPGGLGTIEELFEMLTWAQLGIHGKPCGLLNVAGYFDRLLEFLDHTVGEGFIRSPHRDLLYVDTSPAGLLDQFGRHRPRTVAKWLDSNQG